MTGRRRPRAGAARALALAVGACVVAMAPGVAAAPGVDALDAQREQVRVLSAELSDIDRQTGEAADAHAHSTQRLGTLRERIERNGVASGRARAAHARARSLMEERLLAIYTRREPGPVEVLLSSGSLTEAVAAQDVNARVGRHDTTLLENLRETRAELAETRRTLVREREAAADAEREARERLEEMEALLDRRRLVLTRAETALEGIVAERERSAALRRAQVAAEGEARRRAGASPEPAAAGSGGPSPEPQADPSPSRSPEPAAESAPEPVPASGGDGPVAGGPSYATLGRIASCESGGNPRAVSSSGQYRGKYQFDRGTWASVGGSGDPADAPESEQDMRAAMLYIERGPAPWPICGYR